MLRSCLVGRRRIVLHLCNLCCRAAEAVAGVVRVFYISSWPGAYEFEMFHESYHECVSVDMVFKVVDFCLPKLSHISCSQGGIAYLKIQREVIEHARSIAGVCGYCVVVVVAA